MKPAASKSACLDRVGMIPLTMIPLITALSDAWYFNDSLEQTYAPLLSTDLEYEIRGTTSMDESKVLLGL